MRLATLATACIMLCGCAAHPAPDRMATINRLKADARAAERDALEAERELRAALEEMARTPYGDGGPCPLHGTEQKLDRVPVVYGYVAFSPEYLKAWNEQFPNAGTLSLGGCIQIPGSPAWQTVYYCPQCREAQKEWERLHPVASRPPEGEPTPRPRSTP